MRNNDENCRFRPVYSKVAAGMRNYAMFGQVAVFEIPFLLFARRVWIERSMLSSVLAVA